jgi:hypothetical protein
MRIAGSTKKSVAGLLFERLPIPTKFLPDPPRLASQMPARPWMISRLGGLDVGYFFDVPFANLFFANFEFLYLM